VKRRALLVLSGSILTVSAGCARLPTPGESDGDDLAYALWVTNETDEDVAATITITREDDASVFSETVDLTPDYRWELDEALAADGPLVVAIDVSDGPSGTTEWSNPRGESLLHADIRDSHVDFVRSAP